MTSFTTATILFSYTTFVFLSVASSAPSSLNNPSQLWVSVAADQEPQSSPETESSGPSNLTKIAPSVVVVIIFLAGAAIAFYYWRRRRHQVFVEAVMNDGQQPGQRPFNDQL